MNVSWIKRQLIFPFDEMFWEAEMLERMLIKVQKPWACANTAALLTCVVAGCAARLASSGPWMEAQVSRWVHWTIACTIPAYHYRYHITAYQVNMPLDCTTGCHAQEAYISIYLQLWYLLEFHWASYEMYGASPEKSISFWSIDIESSCRVVLCRPLESRVRDVPWQTPPEALDQPVLIIIIYHNHLNHLCNQVSGCILSSGSLKVLRHESV